jgi:hypothetical protein
MMVAEGGFDHPTAAATIVNNFAARCRAVAHNFLGSLPCGSKITHRPGDEF